jgi:hypothetical protein
MPLWQGMKYLWPDASAASTINLTIKRTEKESGLIKMTNGMYRYCYELSQSSSSSFLNMEEDKRVLHCGSVLDIRQPIVLAIVQLIELIRQKSRQHSAFIRLINFITIQRVVVVVVVGVVLSPMSW